MGKAGLSGGLRASRDRAGLTQQDLADRAGLSVGGLRDLEQGRVATPPSATLRRLAAGLGLSDVETERFGRLGQRTQPPAYDLRIQVLGPLAVFANGVSADPGSAKQRTLLAALALTPNVPVHLETLVEVMWGGRPPDNAAGLMQNHVSRLRRRLRLRSQHTKPDHLLVATRGGYQLTHIGHHTHSHGVARASVGARRAARMAG